MSTTTRLTVTLGPLPRVTGTMSRPTLIVRDRLSDGRTVYVAIAGERRGCMSHADTPGDAATLLDDARALHDDKTGGAA